MWAVIGLKPCSVKYIGGQHDNDWLVVYRLTGDTHFAVVVRGRAGFVGSLIRAITCAQCRHSYSGDDETPKKNLRSSPYRENQRQLLHRNVNHRIGRRDERMY
jgi:hypothetical protein